MNKLFTLFIYIIPNLLFVACGNGGNNASGGGDADTYEAKDVDYDAMASELCTCMRPMVKLYDELLEAKEEADQEGLRVLLNRMESVSAESEACATKLEQKYGDFVGEGEMKAKAALEKACPRIAKMVASGEELE